mgnify:CR=1 FL=1
MSSECETCHEHITDCQCEKPIDMINNPPHYHGNNFEVIDIIEDFELGFCLGNAIRHILRAGKKGDRIQDLKKAIWYLEKEIADDQ